MGPEPRDRIARGARGAGRARAVCCLRRQPSRRRLLQVRPPLRLPRVRELSATPGDAVPHLPSPDLRRRRIAIRFVRHEASMSRVCEMFL